ncbi:MAG: ATP-binding protein [Ilumatobacter sp.]|uniref:HAMP domain-containing sensor histidine kinase n=1 Tax=Ilumatobacter sp. TaxID=1967498 RepID=UPI00391CCFA1
MSLRWKIAIALASVGVVMTAALGLVTYRSTEQRLIDEIDQSISQAAQILVVANERLPPRRGTFDLYAVRRLDRDGRVVSSTFDEDVAVDRRVVASVVDRRGVVVSTVEAATDERFRLHTFSAVGGAVQVGRSLAETDAVLRDLGRRTIGLVAASAIFAALAGWLIANRVARPLRRLAASADEVGATGRLDVPMPKGAERGTDEVGQLARAFSSMLGALGRSRAEQERLVQDAGHELRTPLTSLRTNLAVLRRHPDMDVAMRDRIVSDLDGEVTELTDLVNELVTVASGELSAQPAEDLDLVDLATRVAERVGHRRQREIRVEASGLVFVSAPRAGIDRAIANLLENSCKFDGSGQPIEVSVGTDPGVAGSAGSAGRAFVRVADRGPGIPVDDLSRIFDRFHRTEATRSMPGSGLGLAIVRDVVTAHGGEVSATNREGGGAIIGFDLPLAVVPLDVSPDTLPDAAPSEL